MFHLRRSQNRGFANHGWLKSYHTFSFADYMDPQFMGFRTLRVINEDFIAAGKGFATHGHNNMEIISYVVRGALEHQDTLGNSTLIQPGEVQRMSAGTGVRHSEYNPLPDQDTHLLQIWILPAEQNIEPSYEQKSFAKELETQNLTLVCSPNGQEGSVSLNQDVRLSVGKFKMQESLDLAIPAGRHLWIQVIKGPIKAQDFKLEAGDGLAVSEERHIRLTAGPDTECLIFELP